MKIKILKSMTMMMFFFSTNIFAHPHHNYSIIIHENTISHFLFDHKLILLIVVAMSLLSYKLVNRFYAKQTNK